MKNVIANGILAAGSTTSAAALGAADSTAPVQLRSVKKIVDDGSWNGVPALTQWRDEYWLAYRNATGHELRTGDIVISTSKDSDTWRERRRLNLLKDDRDPHFIATPDRLFLYTYNDDHGNHCRRLRCRTTSGIFVTYTDDGKTWSEPQSVYLSHFILWGRPLAHGDRFYAAAHRYVSIQNSRCHLITSSDGIHWEKVSTIRAGKAPGETALHFAPDGRLTAFLRNNDRARTLHGVILESLPPYTQWGDADVEWKERDAGVHLAGQCAYTFNGVTYLTSRVRPNNDNKFAGAIVYTYEGGALKPYCDLPARGDCSYPVAVQVDPDEMMVVYYSNDITAPARSDDPVCHLYLARVPLKSPSK